MFDEDSPKLPAYKQGLPNLDAFRESHDVFASMDRSFGDRFGDRSNNEDSRSVFESR